MDTLSPTSFWSVSTPDTTDDYPPLSSDIEVDVAIVGAGITGLTTACHLKNAGKRVAVLDAGSVAAGTSSGTSAHLDAVPEHGASALIESVGLEAAQAITRGRMDAIAQIEAWSQAFSIDSEFKRVTAFSYSETPEDREALVVELQGLRNLGLDAAAMVSEELPFPFYGGCRIAQQARFRPVKYLQGLARALHDERCTIYQHTRMLPPEDGTPCRIQTVAGHTVHAQAVVLATHSAFLGVSHLDTRIAPYQSYVITAAVEQGLADALYWDAAAPYHYIRLLNEHDSRILVVGGADHKTGQSDDERVHFTELEQFVDRHFGLREVLFRWSAQFFESSDHLPFIGRVPTRRHIYIGTGYSGVGLTYGTLAGKMISELILHEATPLGDVLSPSRIRLRESAGNYLRENFNVASHFVKDRLAAQSAEGQLLEKGTGSIVKEDGKVLAIYRDEAGKLHELEATCTHAGCIVQWNDAEKTWDCPCHGGRFSPEGVRLYGPPVHDLKPFTDE
ncbi:MAG: FAD-dependent oxidoreductase [Bdellovibrionales bacterium]|nr:FAD-dependent oxidoreductase [Bdellovibrionales bacterium]